MSELEDSEFEYANLAENGSDDSDVESDLRARKNLRMTIKQLMATNKYKCFKSSTTMFPIFGCPSTFNVDNFEVLDYFQLFFDNDLINLLITESNRYAEQQPRSSSDVLSITTDKMQIFLYQYYSRNN